MDDDSRANAIVEYRFTESFDVFVGYDWFKLDVDQKGSDGVVGLKQAFKRPIAGISLTFWSSLRQLSPAWRQGNRRRGFPAWGDRVD